MGSWRTFFAMGYVAILLACLAMSVVSGTGEHLPEQVSGAAPERLFPERDVKLAHKEGYAQGREETLKLLCKGQPSFGKCAQLLGNPLQVGEGLAAASGGRRRRRHRRPLTPAQRAAKEAAKKKKAAEYQEFRKEARNKAEKKARDHGKRYEQSRLRGWLYHLMPKNREEQSKKLLNETVPGLIKSMMPVSPFVCPEWSSKSTQRDEWVTIHGNCAATHDLSGNENSEYSADDPCKICINGKEEKACIEARGTNEKNKWLLNEYESSMRTEPRMFRRPLSPKKFTQHRGRTRAQRRALQVGEGRRGGPRVRGQRRGPQRREKP